MKRALLLLVTVCCLSLAASASPINFVNDYGTVTVLTSGIVSHGIQLENYNGIMAPPGHSLGTVAFTTGALLSGSVLGGGIFSSTGSSFVVTGVGNYGEPKGTIFSGSFFGPITWSLVSHVGQAYLFNLAGDLTGTLYTGRTVTGWTIQTVTLFGNQYAHDHKGGVGLGYSGLGVPETGTIWMMASGLACLALVTASARLPNRSAGR